MRAGDRDDWFELWFHDKRSIEEIMIRNMIADIEAGYDPTGNIIKRERDEIQQYRKEVDDQIERFKEMEDAAVNRWCYYDMKKRGAIA